MPFTPNIPSLRVQQPLRNAWLQQRLDSLLPALMERAGVDMWLVTAREYNDDPVLPTLLPWPSFGARRRTVLVMVRRADGSMERLTLDRYGYGAFYTMAWNPDEESQDDCLRRLVAERNPQRIGINVSSTFAFADGLSHQEHERLTAALGAELSGRCVSAEALAIGWLETRIPAETAVYPELTAIGHRLIRTAFSREVITPGITTCSDVAWWMREQLHAAGLPVWFQPTVALQAHGVSFADTAQRDVIYAGDLLHCDVGFTLLGLCTDQQQQAYVLRAGETQAPLGLRMVLEKANLLQDLLLNEMEIGRSGNEVLAATRARALAEGITPSVYTHPLGFHGHAAGPTIGLWDQQNGVAGGGDYPLYDNTAYSIELNATAAVAEWGGQIVRMALEEDALLADGRVRWLSGRQTALHLI